MNADGSPRGAIGGGQLTSLTPNQNGDDMIPKDRRKASHTNPHLHELMQAENTVVGVKVEENGNNENAQPPADASSEKGDLDYLMGKLTDKKKTLVALENELGGLRKDLEEMRNPPPKTFSEALADSHGISPSMQNESGGHHRECEKVWYFHEEVSSSPSREEIKWTEEEMNVWKKASLPQLFSMRRRLLSSLYGISDAIIQKRMNEANTEESLKVARREDDSFIFAAMHRLLAEAFYVSSPEDPKKLFTMIETLNDSVIEVFDQALLEIRNMTEGGEILDSQEKFQEYLRQTPSRFTTKWRKEYLRCMRYVLVAFVIGSRGNRLLNARRKELEEMTRREMIHTALLSLAQGRDAVYKMNPFSLLSYEKPSDAPVMPDSQRYASKTTSCAPHDTRRQTRSAKRASSHSASGRDINARVRSPQRLPREPVATGLLRACDSPKSFTSTTRRRPTETLSSHKQMRRRETTDVARHRIVGSVSPRYMRTPERSLQSTCAVNLRAVSVGRGTRSHSLRSVSRSKQMIGTAVQLTVSSRPVKPHSSRFPSVNAKPNTTRERHTVRSTQLKRDSSDSRVPDLISTRQCARSQ